MDGPKKTAWRRRALLRGGRGQRAQAAIAGTPGS